ncbi:hypothetical protein Q31b_49800 [Novipirellula aureliae]|uniref:Uncharacterized protein n=1 Tax=Novipirellula aureliae TaxID=2527966 RepID=A0A5C6DIZ9_9BACT|nr:hypothetical protein [Novipirellula aureliae]TWU36698.1 hypothetical protein Q31b_49800 [Novipirellula aureliae]
MWNVNEQGHGSWTENTNTWWFDARGGTRGVSIGFGRSEEPLVQLTAADQDAMPKLAEQFVRGDQWHLSFPETDDDTYSLKVVLRPIPINGEGLLIEFIVSLQTRLLDTHPTVDLVAVGNKNESISPSEVGCAVAAESGSNPITITHDLNRSVAIVMGTRDYPFTTDRSNADGIRLRLFGEFLEKGVIRKARFWTRLMPTSSSIDREELVGIFQELENAALPLRS